MSHADEYTDAMVTAMDLIWGEGFMAPGGVGNVAQLVRGLALEGKEVLDIGCGQGLPSCLLARDYGARVTGTDLEAHLIDRARRCAEDLGLTGRVHFEVVQPGPMPFADERFDVIVISGAMTQVADKLSTYRECLRVLRPGGVLSCYDWMKPPGPLSDDMHYWFELEGLTYELRTPEEHMTMLEEAGFDSLAYRDKSDWYRRESAREYELLQGELRPEIVRLLGDDETQHFIEDWRMLAKLCESGEQLQIYSRACRPGSVPSSAH